MNSYNTYLQFARENLEWVADCEKYLYPDDIPNTKGYPAPRKIRSYRPVEVRTTPKIGRNQLCECGSGLKFKKCCK